jgi:hypothetical protein
MICCDIYNGAGRAQDRAPTVPGGYGTFSKYFIAEKVAEFDSLLDRTKPYYFVLCIF